MKKRKRKSYVLGLRMPTSILAIAKDPPVRNICVSNNFVKPKNNFYFGKNKCGTILVENVIFIVLNLVFLSILVLFLYSKMSDTAILEEQYAKKIALAIDAARPGMNLSFNMGEVVEKKDKDYHGKIVSIQENEINVKLTEGSGYSYSFFNDVDFDYLYYPHEEEDREFFKIGVRKK